MSILPSRNLQYIIVSALFAALFIFAPATVQAQQSGVTLKTVVIDAGHGGKDPGAVSLDKKLQEKTVVLDVALTLGNLIKKNHPEVNVIYTRDKDVYVELNKRTDIANKNHADLFISIHCNSVPKNSKAPSGCETFVMGMNKSESNMAVCRTENSVILLEDDYTATYQGYNPDDPESFIFFNLMQNAYFEQSLIMADLCQQHLKKSPIPTNRGIKQGGLLVLWRTTMPSVLVELGFVTNQSDRNVLSSKEKRTQLATQLYKAFSDFKNQYEDSVGSVTTVVAEPQDETMEESEPVKADSGYYAIQIFAVSREIKDGAAEFKGMKNIGRFKSGKITKYSTGIYSTPQEAEKALPAIAKKFPGAFIVHVENGVATRLSDR
ncbi:MAG: N-acetylmuramoyl-L-alanine amidase [Bacteroidales bacterium]|nr:N-acetylmuramoyl-L-alanine amidase [Bacteroidales bacterium]